jgi:hypothetical protein
MNNYCKKAFSLKFMISAMWPLSNGKIHVSVEQIEAALRGSLRLKKIELLLEVISELEFYIAY